MNILVDKHPVIQFIYSYLDFNEIGYQEISIRNERGVAVIPNCIENQTNQLLIISLDDFTGMLSWDVSRNKLINWVNNGNHIMLSRDGDAIIWFENLDREAFLTVDKAITKHAITILVDCEMSDRYWFNSLKNIRVLYFPNLQTTMALGFDRNGQTPRIRGASVNKNNNSRDFMLTMIKKPNRPHRDILWKQLQSRTGLIDRGHVVYRRFNDPWLGHDPGLEVWPDSVPSMDLYNNSWLEVVPETVYKNMYCITEKSIKPLGTFTPFLTLSTARYLEYLRDLGFKTFDGIIDEKYDTMHRVEDRARMIVDQLEDISRNGAREFYEACRDRVTHNFHHLAEMRGSWQFYMDNFLKETLELVVDQ